MPNFAKERRFRTKHFGKT